MIVNIKKAEAEQVLLKAFRERCLRSDDICKKIKAVLTGSHKTYKYVLLTGLLAKATDSSVNALALQAGAPFDGAYDARSLCHGVIVPFERDFLQNALGGSNEPYLNKPARFTHLSSNNAVRKGNLVSHNLSKKRNNTNGFPGRPHESICKSTSRME